MCLILIAGVVFALTRNKNNHVDDHVDDHIDDNKQITHVYGAAPSLDTSNYGSVEVSARSDYDLAPEPNAIYGDVSNGNRGSDYALAPAPANEYGIVNPTENVYTPAPAQNVNVYTPAPARL